MTDRDDRVTAQPAAEATSLAERLLDAAEAEIVAQGSTEISLRAVARRVGVSHQAPGYAFTDRAGMLSALAARGFTLIDRAVLEARDGFTRDTGRTDPRARLAEMGVAYVLASARRPALFRLMARSDLPDRRGELGAARTRALDTLLDAVREAIDTGWHRNEPPERIAALVWSVIHGLAVLHSDGGLRHLVDAPLEEVARDTLWRFLDC